MMLEGTLVDLVPLGDTYDKLEHRWENGPAAFWGDMGDRQFFTHAHIDTRQRERHESDHPDLTAPFGIQTKDGTPIGSFFIAWVQTHHRTAMLGAMLGEPEYWGGGYGTDALLLATDYAFEWMDLRRLWLMTMALNERVLRQMAKVGFQEEGRRRAATLVDGVWHDVVMFGLLRDEWPGREAVVERLELHERAR